MKFHSERQTLYLMWLQIETSFKENVVYEYNVKFYCLNLIFISQYYFYRLIDLKVRK